MDRRKFIVTTGGAVLAPMAMAGAAGNQEGAVKGKFKISIAAWTWHKMFERGEITMMDQIGLAKKAGGVGLELVNRFFPSPQYDYLKAFLKRAEDEGICILLIMCDDEGNMNDPDLKERNQSVINHRKWLDIAAVLGCHSIRCNVGYARVTPEEGLRNAAESFYDLCQYAKPYGLNVIIENHGGMSSDPEWLVSLMKTVGLDNFGTLPDFGNFSEGQDIYGAVKAMMPYAKAVSAKSYDFDAAGNETTIDYEKMIPIVLEAGYHEYLGVEFEGDRMSELDGADAGVKLLKRFQETG